MGRPSVRTMRRLATVAAALFASCRGGDRAAAASDSLLHSTDSVAVYDAGVEAFKRKDYASARRFWKHAMELGDHNAESNLGYLLYYGLGGEADSLIGADLWRDAARRGDAEAHVHLARVIADGDAGAGTMLEAYSHAVAAEILAAQSRDDADAAVGRDASALKARIAAKLGSDERALADSQGHGWARGQQ